MVLVLLVFCVSLDWGAAIPPSKIGPLVLDTFRTITSESSFVNDARRYGYPAEEHLVKTQDGYILRIFRMPPSPNAPCKMPLPVYVHHGLTESSDFWLLSGPKRALAYVLADAGYDVWLGNARGSMYSRNHETISANNSMFWKFSYHEIALYDNPAVIDYILAQTNQTQLHYIGHSQGTTTFFILNSIKTEYNDKFRTMHGLTPVTYFKNQISPFFTFATKYSETLMRLYKENGVFEFLPNLWIFRLFAEAACKETNIKICFGLLRLIGGQSPLQEVDSIFPRVFSIFPAGSSMLQLIHYTQSIRNGDFKMFDYGERRNLKKYGQPKPPDYPLEKVVATPIYLYASGGDYISQLPDVELLMARLPKKPVYIEIEDKKFGHFDYAFGRYAKELVYDKIISAMKAADGDDCQNQPR